MKRLILIVLVLLVLPQYTFSQIMNIHLKNGQLEQFRLSEVDSITFGSVTGTLKWMGRSSVKIKTNEGVVIYIDPYAGDDYAEPADILLVTHGHSDHSNVSLITKSENCETYIGPHAASVVEGQILAPGDSVVSASGIKIKAVFAYCTNHPKGECVGFVLDINGIKIYHAGDTDKIDEMAELEKLHIDYMLLQIDGALCMGPEQAMEAVEVVKPRYAIPVHRARLGASEDEKQENVNRFTSPQRMILDEGDEIFL